MKKLLIATHNAGKLKEFAKLFENKFEVLSLPYNGFDGEAEETGKTFYENALLKAKFVHDNTGELVLADDSGLCVNALNGEPGIYSARYGGENSTQAQKNSVPCRSCKARCFLLPCFLIGAFPYDFGYIY